MIDATEFNTALDSAMQRLRASKTISECRWVSVQLHDLASAINAARLAPRYIQKIERALRLVEQKAQVL